MEFVLRGGERLVTYRVAGRPGPGGRDPPGCFTPGCINGPPQRKRVQALLDDLGWQPFEPDDEKNWVPLLLH